MALQECCTREAADNLTGHRDVATCDGCGRLLLAYGDEETFRMTVEELESRGADFESGRQGELWVVAKARP